MVTPPIDQMQVYYCPKILSILFKIPSVCQGMAIIQNPGQKVFEEFKMVGFFKEFLTVGNQSGRISWNVQELILDEGALRELH